jgi:hypothetical protein
MVSTEYSDFTTSASGYHASLHTRDLEITAPTVQTLAWLACVFRVPITGPPHYSIILLVQETETLSIMLGGLQLIIYVLLRLTT